MLGVVTKTPPQLGDGAATPEDSHSFYLLGGTLALFPSSCTNFQREGVY